jgi:hypothetical protein
MTVNDCRGQASVEWVSCGAEGSTRLITRAGLPTTTTLSGTSFVTTEPAPTVTPLPIVTPGLRDTR